MALMASGFSSRISRYLARWDCHLTRLIHVTSNFPLPFPLLLLLLLVILLLVLFFFSNMEEMRAVPPFRCINGYRHGFFSFHGGFAPSVRDLTESGVLAV